MSVVERARAGDGNDGRRMRWGFNSEEKEAKKQSVRIESSRSLQNEPTALTRRERPATLRGRIDPDRHESACENGEMQSEANGTKGDGDPQTGMATIRDRGAGKGRRGEGKKKGETGNLSGGEEAPGNAWGALKPTTSGGNGVREAIDKA